jgi:DNA repair protein RecO (recombination protein O)
MRDPGASLLHGIVIGSINYGEADTIVTIYTKEKGKITALAKGSRKLTSRKRSALLLFCKISLSCAETRGMWIVREAKLITSFEVIRTNLTKVSLAYFFCEVIKKITPEHTPQPEIYDLLSKALARLEHTSKLKFLKNAFITHILDYSGFSTSDSTDPVKLLNEVLERELGSVRVGRVIQ